MLNWQISELGSLILVFVMWETFWKGISLWKSAKKGDLIWFIAIFLINFFGLIPLFYLWRTKQLKVVLRDFQGFFKNPAELFHKVKSGFEKK
ncbi:hypothetical protein KKE78_01995 [Patescibacteria group bacterium]|nr:hypothetical protein [Patescibacteria group bacterium]